MILPFSKAFVIHLNGYHAERIGRFFRELPACLCDVDIWPGVDGRKLKPPNTWTAGPGMWGCYRSHMQILEYCYQRDIESYIVFEDDATFLPEFETESKAFMSEVPDTWQQVYLGGQLIRDFISPPQRISPNVIRPWNVNRTHAMAVHRRGYDQMYRHLQSFPFEPEEPFDTHLGRLHESGLFHVYCPNRWLVGQSAGQSSINGNEHPEMFWLDPGAVTEAHEMRLLPPTIDDRHQKRLCDV